MTSSTFVPLKAMVLIACLLATATGHALTVDDTYHALGQEAAYLENPAGNLTIEQLLAAPASYPFIPLTQSKPANSFSPVWIKLELNFSEAAQLKRYYLVARVENINEIRLYRPLADGEYRETITGNRYPAATRELPIPRYGFVIEPTEKALTLYIRYIGGPGTRHFPWSLVEEQTYYQSARLYYLLDVACLSAIAALLLFNISIALTLRRREYACYSAYIFFVMMTLLTMDGLGFYFLWPDHPWWNDRALHGFNLASAAMRLMTILGFLGVASFAPRLHRAGRAVLAITAAALLLVILVGTSSLPPLTAAAPWLIANLFGFVVCAYAIHRRIRLALPLLITLLVPSIAAIVQALLIVNNDEVSMLELQVAKIGFVLHILLFSLCLAARIKQETAYRITALHDGLTGLPGSRLLQERFDQAAALARRQDWQMAVLFIDLDGFKAVNDNHGHAAGDQLLAAVAQRLQRQLRETDTVARIGGDEFVVLLTEVREPATVYPVAGKLLSAVAEPYRIGEVEARISASIGIAIYPSQGESLQGLLRLADAGMYAAKSEGKNTCRAADPKVISANGHHFCAGTSA